MSQRVAGEKAYRTVLREAFRLGGQADVPLAGAGQVVAREIAGRQHLGAALADQLVAEEAEAWRAAKGICPWCGSEPHEPLGSSSLREETA